MPSVDLQTSPSLEKPQSEATSRSGVVEINVGGQTFTTTRETLEAAGTSYFSGLMGGNFGTQRDSRGQIFIDRDRTCLHHFPTPWLTSEQRSGEGGWG
jgi:hypothetical protein